MRLFYCFLVFLFISCSNEPKKVERDATVKVGEFLFIKNKQAKKDSVSRVDSVKRRLSDKETKELQELLLKVDTLEQRIIDAGLIDVQTLNDSIFVDLKYSTTNNFMHRNLYGKMRKAYLQPVVAKRLAKVQTALSDIDSSLHLLVYDAVRPRSVQWEMWKGLDTIPINQRVKFVSNPKNGSIHNYGCAIDLTLCNNNKVPLDMGAAYDDLRKIAYPRHEAKFLASGELTEKQLQNRKLLRQVMRTQGFWVIQTEWWHFNGYSRAKAKELFNAVE